MPVAVNCCELPRLILGLAGVTVMVLRAALFTVREAVPTTLPNFAVMVAVPALTLLARPRRFVVLLMVATDNGEDVQVTEFVKSWVLPSPKVAVAVNCCSNPAGSVAGEGETLIDCSAEASTTRSAVLETAPNFAVMVAVPADCPVACPEPAPMVATLVAEELQVTELLMVCVEPSL